MNPLAELQSSREVMVSDRAAHRLARDGGWQQMPPALTPRVIVSRREVLDAHGLTDCEIAHLQGLADAAERRMWKRRADTVIALILIAAIVYVSLWLGPEFLLHG